MQPARFCFSWCRWLLRHSDGFHERHVRLRDLPTRRQEGGADVESSCCQSLKSLKMLDGLCSLCTCTHNACLLSYSAVVFGIGLIICAYLSTSNQTHISLFQQDVRVDGSELLIQERGAFEPYFERRDCCFIACSPLRNVHTKNIKRMPLNISFFGRKRLH